MKTKRLEILNKLANNKITPQLADEQLINLLNSKSKYINNRFTPPFRVGRKNNRIVLDNKGLEVAHFYFSDENMADDYVQYLNKQIDRINDYCEYLVKIYSENNLLYKHGSLYWDLKQFLDEGKINNLVDYNDSFDKKIRTLNHISKEIIDYFNIFKINVKVFFYDEFINNN